MAVCPSYKKDSNLTGLRYAEEECLKQLPGVGGADAIWFGLEPNSYSDFGGQITTVARNPINPSRQRQKGVVTDLEASGGFNQDLTSANTVRLMQGFMFADARERASTHPLNGDAVAITAVTATEYEAAAGLDVFEVGDLVVATGFGASANNGLKVLTAAAADGVAAAGLVAEAAPPAGAKLAVVGFQGTAGDLSIAMNGSLVRLVSAAAEDFTSRFSVLGEWVFLGGDNAANRFANNVGFARISAIGEDYLEFDKVTWTPQAEAGAGKTLRVFTGIVIKNEKDPTLIKRRTYHVERTLGQDEDGEMSEYLIGAVANEFTMNVPQADKVNIDMAFIALDNEQRDGSQGLKPGARPVLPILDAINTSSDFARIKLAVVDPAVAAPVPLFAYASDVTVTINNNVSGLKAIGVLGSFDTTTGTFEVGGELTAYFADIAGVRAVRNNEDITLDIIMVKNNAGMLFDVPLLSLGNGRLNVEQDQPITLPLETSAAESSFGHTLLFQSFEYLPTIAKPVV